MGDQPVTRADFDRLVATIKDVVDQMATLSTTTTAWTTALMALTAKIDNIINNNRKKKTEWEMWTN